MFKAFALGLGLILSVQLHASNARAACEELLRDVELRMVISQNIARVHEFPGQWAVASQAIMLKVMEYYKYNNLDYHFFERFFRNEGVPLYLVASSEALPDGYSVGMPHALEEFVGSERKYHLWVGVNGEAEAAAFKAHLGITDEENLQRLKDTGVIVVDSRENLHPDSTPLDDKTAHRLDHVRRKLPTDIQSN